MKNNLYGDPFDQNSSPLNLSALLFRYLNYWYYFVGSLIFLICVVCLYLKTKTPIYEVNASVFIEEQSKSSNSSSISDMENLGFFAASSSFNNEIELLQARTLIKDVIINSGFYINYEKRGVFCNESMYKKSPINVLMTPDEALKLVGGAQLSIQFLSNGNISVVAKIKDNLGEEVEYTKIIDKLPSLLSTPQGTFSFEEGIVSNLSNWTPSDELIVSINSPITVAAGYSRSLSVIPTSKSTTIADVRFECTNKQQGVDFVYKLIELYNQKTNDYKNEVAFKTSKFINDRILILNNELGSTEAELEEYKKLSKITDIKSDAQLALSENSSYQQQIVENSTQLHLVQFLRDYASDPENEFEVLPINVGLTDVGLSQLISSYNVMLLERKRLLVTSSESNPTVVNLNASIASMRRNVFTTVESVYQGLLIRRESIERESDVYAGRISSAPTKERELVSISRRQEIQSSLYLMLLQKREENALTLASTANNARIVNDPLASGTPIAPNKKVYMLIALILGISIPAVVIFLKDALNLKIEKRTDVEKITKIPVLAEIPKQTGLANGNSIVIHENKNDKITESFRFLRTNTLFKLEKNQKVIMVTSTISKEGKSFTAANLAISLALTGKKVIVVGLDIRKQGLNKVFGIEKRYKGVSDYLAAGQSMDILSLIYPSKNIPNLSILFGGTILSNPSELLFKESLDVAIATLKEHYDYIILDTAPVGVIADTQIISRVADISLYVCRAGYTKKSIFGFVNTLHNETMQNLAIVINDVKMQDYSCNNMGYSKYEVQ